VTEVAARATLAFSPGGIERINLQVLRVPLAPRAVD